MELNNNLIGIQGILIKCKMQTGDFTKINYVGGNEKHIRYITTEIANFLISRQLWEEKKVPPNHVKDLNEIIFFLALNTEFKKPLQNVEEFAHLSNIIPQLSKCILAIICFALNLVEHYGYVIENFPLETVGELLDQAVECLRKGKLEDHIHNAFIILKSVVNKLSLVNLSYKTEDSIDEITGISSLILQNLTNMTSDQVHSMNASKIYQHMGFTLLRFFELLLYVDENKETLTKLLGSLISTTCNIIKCVTLNVFCSWAEVNYEDQPLQTEIAGRAYLVMEKFQKNKLASELISMLSTIARKPKTIAERILDADVSTMIEMVNKRDENQKLWFSALFNKPVFSDPKILECVETWWHLCNESSIGRLLNSSVPKNSREKYLIIKCASNLTYKELAKVLTTYFNREHFKWSEDTTSQLVILFNQINGTISEEELKHILLLILQNARVFFYHFYTTAFKRSSELTQIFELVQFISKVENIGLEILMQVLDENTPTTQNISNYVQLFNTMISCQYFTWDFIVTHIFLPLVSKYRNDESNLEEFKCCLRVLEHFKHLKCQLTREMELCEYILTCAAENRCKSFLEFECLKNEITSISVDYVLSKCQDFKQVEGRKESFPNLGSNLEDPWSNYYKNLLMSNEDTRFTEWILPNFKLSNYREGEVEENFTRMLKILPRCVPTEWKLLLNEIIEECNFSVALNALSDIMILLCDFAENQLRHQQNETLLAALQFCLQNYGSFIVWGPKSEVQEISAINSVCRVLKHIPDPLKPSEGLSLINTLPEKTLKKLSEDKEFVGRIIIINDDQLCKALAQKVLASKHDT